MSQLAVEIIDVGMIGGILIVGNDQLSVDGVEAADGVWLFGNELLPVVDARMTEVGHHDTAFGSLIVGVEVELVAHRQYGTILIVHVGSHLNEL